MTPAARYSAAITILDNIQNGETAEHAISGWGRNNRYAGSKDRAAIRDHVFDVLRTKRSCAVRGGGASGRELVIGLLKGIDVDPQTIFTGEGYAPEGLNEDEKNRPTPSMTEAEAHDLPDWAWGKWVESLGSDASAAAQSQRSRATVSLRVNTRKGSGENAANILAEDEIETDRHPDVATCLLVQTNPRRLARSRAYLDGYVELQDASSQSAVAALDIPKGARVLDYCAGGGGKSLALVDLHDVKVSAYDVAPKRMVDLPARSFRAGVIIDILDETSLATEEKFDVVFCDAPCSGSGTWRRTPDAKWRMTLEDFERFPSLQGEVIRNGAAFLKNGGQLIYATCSVFREENEKVISQFLERNSDFHEVDSRLVSPSNLDDGFYFCVLQKVQ